MWSLALSTTHCWMLSRSFCDTSGSEYNIKKGEEKASHEKCLQHWRKLAEVHFSAELQPRQLLLVPWKTADGQHKTSKANLLWIFNLWGAGRRTSVKPELSYKSYILSEHQTQKYFIHVRKNTCLCKGGRKWRRFRFGKAFDAQGLKNVFCFCFSSIRLENVFFFFLILLPFLFLFKRKKKKGSSTGTQWNTSNPLQSQSEQGQLIPPVSTTFLINLSFSALGEKAAPGQGSLILKPPAQASPAQERSKYSLAFSKMPK